MTASPVVSSVSHATRPVGSSARMASRTESLIWSAILSGWPSVTDSEVKRQGVLKAGNLQVMVRSPYVTADEQPVNGQGTAATETIGCGGGLAPSEPTKARS